MAVTDMIMNISKGNRLMRGLIGVLLISMAAGQKGFLGRWVQGGTGWAFLFYGLTGVDVLETLFEKYPFLGQGKDSLMNMAKNALPGQGHNPMNTQQPQPKNVQSRDVDSKTTSELTAVGA